MQHDIAILGVRVFLSSSNGWLQNFRNELPIAGTALTNSQFCACDWGYRLPFLTTIHYVKQLILQHSRIVVRSRQSQTPNFGRTLLILRPTKPKGLRRDFARHKSWRGPILMVSNDIALKICSRGMHYIGAARIYMLLMSQKKRYFANLQARNRISLMIGWLDSKSTQFFAFIVHNAY